MSVMNGFKRVVWQVGRRAPLNVEMPTVILNIVTMDVDTKYLQNCDIKSDLWYQSNYNGNIKYDYKGDINYKIIFSH